MKNLFLFSAQKGESKFLWNEISLDKNILGGKAEWAKNQLKNETADALGNLLEKDVLTKDEVIQLLDTEEAKKNWNYRTDTPSNSARYVLALQAGLKILGHNSGRIDALFGKNTKAAVIAFQTKEGLKVDGAPGPETIGKILEELRGLSIDPAETERLRLEKEKSDATEAERLEIFKQMAEDLIEELPEEKKVYWNKEKKRRIDNSDQFPSYERAAWIALLQSVVDDSKKEFLMGKGMSPEVFQFLQTKESEGRTIDQLFAERGYSMELVQQDEQVKLNNQYKNALGKIESEGELTPGTYSVIFDAGSKMQKGYLIQKNEKGWEFLKTFPISTGRNGISNIAGTQTTPEGLVFVDKIINGKLDEIIKHKAPQNKFSKLEGKATVNTTALILRSGESQNTSIYNRGVYAHETEKISQLGTPVSGGCIRTGTFVATEIGEYLKKNDRAGTPIFIANTLPETEHLAQSFENQEVVPDNVFAEKLINSAKDFQGHPYDTSWDDKDGFASLQQYDGEYHYLDNFTGEKKTTMKKPLVCIDLVVESLRKIAHIPSLEQAMKKGKFYMRRTTNFEKLVNENPQDFEVSHPEYTYKFPEKKLSGSLAVSIGDILTTTNLKTGSRHVGIVTEVDSKGTPMKIVHSNYKGVTETPFFNSKEEIDKNHGKKRYDGFLAETTRIDSVIRPKVQTLLASR